MSIERIVSFLPSATELLYELGLEDNLYGVTHECNYPKEAKLKPRIITSVVDSENLTSKEIDEMTCKLLNERKDIFVLDENNLKKAEPDLIISQETCEVCAAYTTQISKALKILQKKPMIHSMNPHTLNEILDSVRVLGKMLKKDKKAKEITDSLEIRINKIKKFQIKKKSRVLAIEWLDPFFTAGHWVPEMIEIAGGINQISKVGEHSRRLNMQEIIKINPDIIILMSCGFDAKRILLEYNKVLKENKVWNSLRVVQSKRVFAVDANSFFSKPSIRTVEGLEILAKIIQPDKFQDIKVAKNAFFQIN